jgi:hypothetical protein
MARHPFLAGLLTCIAATSGTSLPVQAVGPTVRSLADNNQRGKSTSESSAQDRTAVDKEVEATARRLVHEHLNELKAVLERLRGDYPQQYKRAIADLAKSARKLEAAKNRDERLFDIEVESLKAQTSLDLLTAKLKVRDNEADRKLLRQAVERLQRAQITRARYDVEALQTRLKRTEQQLKNAQQRLSSRQKGLNEQFEKTYAGILRKAGRQPLESSDPPKSRSPRNAEDSADSQPSANVRKRADRKE